jgi:hypothetical protein
MVRLTERRRTVLAEKFGDLANPAVAALVFGQALGQGSFSLAVGLAGFAIWSVFMAATYFLAGGGE